MLLFYINKIPGELSPEKWYLYTWNHPRCYSYIRVINGVFHSTKKKIIKVNSVWYSISLYIKKEHYLVALRYEISLLALKNISRVGAANEWNIFQHSRSTKNFVSPRGHVIVHTSQVCSKVLLAKSLLITESLRTQWREAASHIKPTMYHIRHLWRVKTYVRKTINIK